MTPISQPHSAGPDAQMAAQIQISVTQSRVSRIRLSPNQSAFSPQPDAFELEAEKKIA